MNKFFERRYVISGIFIGIILILLARLYYIQIVDDRYLLYAKHNAVRPFITYPERGPILDRNGHFLVTNTKAYDVSVIQRQVKDFDTVAFCKIIGIDTAEFNKRFQKAKKYSMNLQSIIEKQLSPEL